MLDRRVVLWGMVFSPAPLSLRNQTTRVGVISVMAE